MSLADAVALVMFAGIVAYACFGGADFGAGVWDLTAGNAKKGAQIRALIDRSIGPVWEANHTWLIFVLVYFWTAFPTAFASVMETLYIPFSIAAFGIVLRGAGFAFRKYAPSLRYARVFGVLFATSSIITPFFFGTAVGAIASGRVPLDRSGDAWSSWTSTTSVVAGVLAVVTAAFLAAVFLTAEAAREDRHDLLVECRLRALGMGVVTGIVALAMLYPLRDDAPLLFDGLTTSGLALIVLSALAGLATIALIITNRYSWARVTALVAVATVISGWGVGQYPWLLVDTITIEDAAGADATLWGLLIVFGIAAVTVLPSLAYMYWITQRPSWVAKKAPAISE